MRNQKIVCSLFLSLLLSVLGGESGAQGHSSNAGAARTPEPQAGSRSAAAQRQQQQQQRKEPPSGLGEKIARFSMPSLMLAGESAS